MVGEGLFEEVVLELATARQGEASYGKIWNWVSYPWHSGYFGQDHSLLRGTVMCTVG